MSSNLLALYNQIPQKEDGRTRHDLHRDRHFPSSQGASSLTLEGLQRTNTSYANFTSLCLFSSFLSQTCVYSRSQEEGDPTASHYTYGKYAGINSTVRLRKMSQSSPFFDQVAKVFYVV